MAECTIYLSLGSNVGEREKNLQVAIAALEEQKIQVRRVSSFYQTEPVDFLEQSWFLNCVVEATTGLNAEGVLAALREIERKMGSRKFVPKGPRLIDLDLLLFGRETIERPELQVPHPRMQSRRFVLVPLAEIAPELKHPSWNVTVADLLERTPDKSQVRRFEGS
jgi:2-amino-4-hydroxy-6-hydroxymethyldihydropteridine diphosphokinase